MDNQFQLIEIYDVFANDFNKIWHWLELIKNNVKR